MGPLEKWFLKNARNFPWRQEISPYRVWISEIMLQQTRASVVIPYFEKWMKEFPDVQTLATAPIEKVIKSWEGLGYYSRARNIHLAAKELHEKYGGNLPNCSKKLLSLKGIGAYTQGAILSFAFHEKAAAIDGNVSRVISRYFCVESCLSLKKTKKDIERSVLSFLDDSAPWITMEALIELGAKICLPRPKCEVCPLQSSCKAKEVGKEEALPIKPASQRTTELSRLVYVFHYKEEVLVRKEGEGKVMADLFEFPYAENWKRTQQKSKIEEMGAKFYEDSVTLKLRLQNREHSFTRYKAKLSVALFTVEKKKELSGFQWVHVGRLKNLPFSSGHRKIREEVEVVL